MKRPSWQHYPGDWQRNAKLRRCSWSARGAWLEILGLMHDNAEEYGVLRWPSKEIANALGCPNNLVKELIDKAVMKGIEKGLCVPYVHTPTHAGKPGEPVTLIPTQEGPIWYSSRMVRDEYNRTVRGQGSRFGEPPKPTPKGGIGETPTAPIGDGASFAVASFKTAVELNRDVPRSKAGEISPLKSNPDAYPGESAEAYRLRIIREADQAKRGTA